jgi:glyoxylate reductase
MTTERRNCRRAYAACRFSADFESAMDERYEVTRNLSGEPLGPSALAQAAAGAEILFISLTERVTADVIERLAPALKVIATLSAGVDHIDLTSAKRLDVRVLHTPDVVSGATAEVALMLILNACRRGHEANQLVRSGQWQSWQPNQMIGLGLEGRRLGILGLGRVGRQIAQRATPFGLQIHYHNRCRLAPEEESGATYHASAEALLSHSDIFCLAAPATPALERFLDAARLALLPPDAVVVNVARGNMVDDDALINALRSGRLFAAGLDVYRGEPDIDPRYRTLPNVFLLPHIGAATVGTRSAMGRLLLDGLTNIEAGGRPANQRA